MEHFFIKKYCKELLKEAATPTATNRYLSVDEKEESIDQTKYISIIGSTPHAWTSSKTYI